MILLLSAAIAAILFLTLLPFRLESGPDLVDIVPELLRPLTRAPRPGDVLRNVILFMPLGFAGLGTIAGRLKVPPRWCRIAVIGGGVLLSLTIEVAQIYIPGRVSNLYDVMFDGLGTALGVVAAIWRQRLIERRRFAVTAR